MAFGEISERLQIRCEGHVVDVGAQEHQRANQPAGRCIGQRIHRVIKKMPGASQERCAVALVARVSRREFENRGLAEVLGGPGFCRKLEAFGASREGRSFELSHPFGIFEQHGTRVGIASIDKPVIGAVLQILAQRLKENGVRPAILNVEQIEFPDLIARMDAAANECVRRRKIVRFLAHKPGVEQRIHGVTRAATGTVIIGIACRSPDPSPSSTRRKRVATVVHVEHPIGQLKHGARDRVAGQKVIVEQSRGVIVFVEGPPPYVYPDAASRRDGCWSRHRGNDRCARNTRRCRQHDPWWYGKCRCRSRGGQWVEDDLPPWVAGAQETASCKSVNDIVLIVVVRDDRLVRLDRS